MSEETKYTANAGYALGRLERALAVAAASDDPALRERAEARADAWRAVLAGMADGSLTIGARTPVADTPAWVTLEVVHGGFATGRYLAEGPLVEHEAQLLAQLPADAPGESPRERLNLWYLGDVGHEALTSAVAQRRLDVTLPEEGALPVVAWLIEHGHEGAALELIAALRPLMHRLRFYPRLVSIPRPGGASVRLSTVSAVAEALRARRPNPRVVAMNATLQRWNPLYDRLVALWLETVEGEAPHLALDARGQLARQRSGQPIVAGGWPCQRWPADWGSRRDRWLADAREARGSSRHDHPKSNFACLQAALERCPKDSAALSGRDVAAIRRALAKSIARHGAPGSPRREALRAEQAAIAARPLHVELAAVLLARLAAYPDDGGLPAVEPVAAPTGEGERAGVPAGVAIPPGLIKKVTRALEAPIDELVERGVIRSSEVIAIVLPQITAQVAAAGIEEPALRGLYEQIYAAFRRRRSLLLLNLEHQVRLDELPWIAALAPLRSDDLGTHEAARQTLEQATVLALSSFPQTILPNPFVRELGALCERAALSLPLVEEVAADIFMGTFTSKWPRAAKRAAQLLEGSLYARYYDLPGPDHAAYREASAAAPKRRRWGRAVADDFAALCRERAAEAGTGGRSFVAANGAILEQSQILTTHNLAILVDGLELRERIAGVAPELAARALRWIVARQSQPPASHFKARLQLVKNSAYALRQALFFLSLCDERSAAQVVYGFQADVQARDPAWARRFAPVVAGVQLILEGDRFDERGRGRGGAARRLLGWATDGHWLLRDA